MVSTHIILSSLAAISLHTLGVLGFDMFCKPLPTECIDVECPILEGLSPVAYCEKY
ncbi:hypothetical protein BUE80_DR005211, partial [Diplocarpon rosae]